MQTPRVERRMLPRTKIRVPAFVDQQYGAPLPCQVVDLSVTSARLDVTDLAVPAEFVLTMKLSTNVQRRCRVIWRSGYAAGVKFNK